jgi:hypothetical protein
LSVDVAVEEKKKKKKSKKRGRQSENIKRVRSGRCLKKNLISRGISSFDDLDQIFWHHFPKVEDENLIYLYRWRIREQNENPKNRERGLGDGEPGAEAIEVPVPIPFLVPVLDQDPAAEDDANKVFKDLHDGLTGGHFSEETTTHKILRFILFYSAINRCPLSLFWVKSIFRIHFPGYFLILYLAFVKAWPCVFSLCKSVIIYFFLTKIETKHWRRKPLTKINIFFYL